MTFKSGNSPAFKEVFNSSKTFIRSFKGCLHLSLLESQTEPDVFFTYSKWQDEAALNQYRDSLLFKNTWAKTKILFAKPAEAWTCLEEELG